MRPDFTPGPDSPFRNPNYKGELTAEDALGRAIAAAEQAERLLERRIDQHKYYDIEEAAQLAQAWSAIAHELRRPRGDIEYHLARIRGEGAASGGDRDHA